jgi:hypothetical protein
MTKQEALMYLNSSEENWKEDLELLIFELKKDLFRRVLIPKLLVKKAEKVAVWYEASQVLREEDVKKINDPVIELIGSNLTEPNNLIQFYRSFESLLMQQQLKLSQSLEPKIVAETITVIADLEFRRQKALLPLAKNLFKNFDNTFEVKISEDAQTGVIISELKQFDKKEFTEKKDLLLLPNFEKDLQRILKSN